MEERISELDTNTEMTQVEEERELRFLKSEETLQGPSDSIRKAKINGYNRRRREQKVYLKKY